MRICEEYLQRHQIKDVPLILSPNRGALLLRKSFPSCKQTWCLLSFYWQEQTSPGNYIFTTEFPLHNSSKNGKLFTTDNPPKKIKWADYENYILELSYRFYISGFAPVNGSYKELTINAWEMFVFQYDEFFSQQQSQVKRLLFETLDFEKSIDDRYKSYELMCKYLEKYSPNVLKIWKFEILMRLQKYSNWLAEIFHLTKPVFANNEG